MSVDPSSLIEQISPLVVPEAALPVPAEKKPFVPRVVNNFDLFSKFIAIAAEQHPNEKIFLFNQGHAHQLKIANIVVDKDLTILPKELKTQVDEGSSGYGVFTAGDLMKRYTSLSQEQKEKMAHIINQELLQPMEQVTNYNKIRKTLVRKKVTKDVLLEFDRQVLELRKSMAPFLKGQIEAIVEVNTIIKDGEIKKNIAKLQRLHKRLSKAMAVSVE